MSMLELIKEFNRKYNGYYTATYAPSHRRGWYYLTITSPLAPHQCIGSFCKKVYLETLIDSPDVIKKLFLVEV